MKRMPLRLRTLPFAIVFIFGVFLLPTNDTRADSLILPNYSATNQIDGAAEGMFVDASREQTVYRATEFPPFPIVIYEIRWRPDSTAGGPITTTVSNIQVFLSTTLANPDQLSSTFFENTGTNDTLVFGGAMNVASSFTTLSNGTKAFDINLPLQTPFLFDPTKGNLLIDIHNFTGCSANLYDNAAGDGADATSRVVAGDPNAPFASFGDTGGGVVQIIYSPATTTLPIVISNPTNQTLVGGSNATFSVTAIPPQVFYQWFFNDTNNAIGEATNSTLVLNSLQTNQAGSYFVRLSNEYGTAYSSNAILTVVPAFIISQPINQVIVPGGTAVFAITAQSVAPLTYQWFFNNTNLILDATNASLVLSNVQAGQLGSYSVCVSNIYGSVNSSNASLSIGLTLPNYAKDFQLNGTAEGPFISTVRQQTVYGASQFPPYPIVITELRWRPDSNTGGPLTDNVPNLQINLSTTITNADHMSSTFAKNVGTNNTVVFSGTMIALTSFTTLSNGTKAFDITLPLQTQFVFDPSKGNLLVDLRNFSGGSANLYDNAVGSTTDAVSRAYSIGDANAASATTIDSGGGAMQIIYFPVPAPPTITIQPSNQSIDAGDSISFGVTAGAPSLSYQWFFNDTNNPISGATNGVLMLTNVQPNQAGGYFVQVTNEYGTVFSSNATLTVVPAFIISQPINQVIVPGGTSVFAITAKSVVPLTYQWFFNATNTLVDATNASLTLTNIQADRIGLYSVRVTDTYGSIDSSNATLKLGIVAPNYAANFQSANTSENTFVSVLRIQTVYGASQFPPYPIVINELRWRPDALAGGPLTDNIPSIQINLSTTATNADHLNSTFAKNNGTNDTVVFSGAASIFTSFTNLPNGTKAFDISLPLQTPFVYDSSKGNLLIDVRNFSGGSSSLYTAGLTTSTDAVSRTYSANPNGATASGADTGAEAMQVLYTPAPLPPTISSQPTNQSLIVGSSTTFNVVAGPLPIAYQWFYNTNTLLGGATNSSLVLTNVQYNQSGMYSVVLSNIYGSTTSAVAVLTANFAPVNVFIGSTNAMGGSSFTIPILVAANGNENTISFSMNFNTQRVAYTSVELGSGAADGALLPNTGEAVNGRLGITMQLPPGETFVPGTQEVARVTFSSAIVSGTQVVTPINFTNQPINRFVYDGQGNKLATNFINGSVTLTLTDFESDVTPRQTGDHNLDIFDWTQEGRFVVGLDIITNAAEFQRADSAPKSTSGDGQLKVTDWVQAARYGAIIDAPVAVGGPTAPVVPTTLTGGPRTINVTGGIGVKGLNLTVPIVLQSQGNENGVGFSVNFDPSVLKYVSTTKGSADASGTLMVNTNQAASGRVGVIVALQVGNNFTNGVQQEIAKLTFASLNFTSNSVVSLANGPALLSVSDPLANELAANYASGSVTINPAPTLTAGFSGSNATLSWPVWGTGFNVQATGDLLGQGWTNIAYSAQTNGGEIIITIPIPAESGYFRLQHP